MKPMVARIDQVGRIVLPRTIRQELAIRPGDLFTVEVHGSSVKLTLGGEKPGLVRKGKALVFSSGDGVVLSAATVNDVLNSVRNKRESQII